MQNPGQRPLRSLWDPETWSPAQCLPLHTEFDVLFPDLQEERAEAHGWDLLLTCMTHIHSEAPGEGGPAACLASSAAALVGSQEDQSWPLPACPAQTLWEEVSPGHRGLCAGS